MLTLAYPIIILFSDYEPDICTEESLISQAFHFCASVTSFVQSEADLCLDYPVLWIFLQIVLKEFLKVLW